MSSPARRGVAAGSEGGDSRRADILVAAARLFATRGYDKTSMRDIAGEVGMLSGSLYYHFQSKDELIEEIYREGARILSEAVSRAIEGVGDPWARLEQACIAHIEARLGGGVFAPVVSSEGLHTPAPLRDKLVAYRDAYEQLFRDLVAALDLPAEIDRSVYRLSLLSALNGIAMWYRPGGRTPREIAQQIFTIYDRRCRA